MKYIRKPLEYNEVIELKKACQTFEEELIVNVLLDTGLRVSELSHLRKDQISWQKDYIVIFGKKVIPVSKKTQFYLTEYFMDKPKICFCPRGIQRIVKRVAKRANILKKVSPDVLRHTFAVYYLHRGGNMIALQDILGHSNIQTTNVYLNYFDTRNFKEVLE